MIPLSSSPCCRVEVPSQDTPYVDDVPPHDVHTHTWVYDDDSRWSSIGCRDIPRRVTMVAKVGGAYEECPFAADSYRSEASRCSVAQNVSHPRWSSHRQQPTTIGINGKSSSAPHPTECVHNARLITNDGLHVEATICVGIRSMVWRRWTLLWPGRWCAGMMMVMTTGGTL